MIETLNNHSEWIMLVAVVILSILLVTVLMLAFVGRWRLNRNYRARQASQSRLRELIVRFVSGDVDKSTVRKALNNRIDFAVLLEQVDLLEESLDGEEEQDKLAELIDEPEIKKYFRKQIRSVDKVRQARACIYYSRRKNIHPEWIPRLMVLSADPKPVLTYAAVSALLVHGDMQTKEQALWNALNNRELSQMALSDLFVRFTRSGEEYHRNEVQVISGFIGREDLPAKKKALLIRVLDELDYFQSMDFLIGYYRSLKKKTASSEVLMALIRILTKFGYEELLRDVHRQYVVSKNPKIRLAAAWSMGFFRQEQSIPYLKWLLNDPAFDVRYEAVRSIVGYRDLETSSLQSVVMSEEEWSALLGEIKAEMA